MPPHPNLAYPISVTITTATTATSSNMKAKRKGVVDIDGRVGEGGGQVVRRLPGGGYAGGSDPRKDGHAVAR